MINFLFTKTPLVFFIQSLWRDEAFSYLLAKRSIWQIITLTASDYNPPLYYLFLHFWIKMFGSSEIALRSLSLIFYWASVYVAFLFFNQIFHYSLKKSFFYLIFIIINPLLIYYAFEARMYSLLVFWAGLSFYFFWQKKSKSYIFATATGLYTHYFMIFVILSQFIYLYLIEKKELKKFIKNFYYLGIAYIPWLVVLLVSPLAFSRGFWIEKNSLPVFLNLLGVIYLGHELSPYAYQVVNLIKTTVLTSMEMIISGLFYIGRLFPKLGLKERRLTFFLLFWALGAPIFAYFISFIKPIFLPRYFIFATFGMVILVIFVFDKFKSIWRILLFSMIFLICFYYQKTQVRSRLKPDLKKSIKEINFLAKKNDLLYVTNELDYMVAQYYFSENRVFIYGKTYDQIPSYTGKILIPKEKMAAHIPIYPSKAFILASDGSYEIKAMY